MLVVMGLPAVVHFPVVVVVVQEAAVLVVMHLEILLEQLAPETAVLVVPV